MICHDSNFNNQIMGSDSLDEEKKAQWERFWHFFSASQKFGEWDVELKNASEKEGKLIMKIQEILKKYGVLDHPQLLKDIFNSLSESEKNTCLNALEVIIKYMKYHPHG